MLRAEQYILSWRVVMQAARLLHKIMNKEEKEILNHIDALLKELRLGWIADGSHNHEINLDCAECRARILEGYLEWLKETYVTYDDK